MELCSKGYKKDFLPFDPAIPLLGLYPKEFIGKMTCIKIFVTKTSDKGLIIQIYKELNQLYPKSSHPPIEKWARDMNGQFSDKQIKTIKKHMRKCSNSLLVR